MWNFEKNFSQREVGYTTAIQETLQATIRNLILVSGIFCLVSLLILSSSWGDERVLAFLVWIVGIGAIFLLASYLLRHNDLLGLSAWIVGMVMAILAGCWLIQIPSLVLLGAILPLIAAILISWPASLVVEGIVIGMALIANRGLLGGILPTNLVVLTIASGAFNGLLGWIACRELLNVAIWSLSNFDQARKKLEEARDRQSELLQAQDDLCLANSELARLSKRLKALEQIAEDARQATTEFVANVSHELRTPLNMIIGYADMISRLPKVYNTRLPSSLLTDINAILRNAQHLSNLVNDVLDLSQVEAGRMVICRSWNSLQQTISEALIVTKGLLDTKGLYLKVEIPPDLPPVFYDETRIRQVVINLLSNAGRFTEQGGVAIRCEIVQDEVVIRIADTGPGIDKKDQERVFEPFQQVDTSIRRRYGGSGLGLTISKRFIEMHGGKMWLESEPGEGTVFSFSLPLKNFAPYGEGIAAQNSFRRSSVFDEKASYRLRRGRSLAPPITITERYMVIDQEQTLQRLMSRYLPNAKIDVVPNIASAVEALSHSPAQALILNAPRSEDAGALANLPFGTPAVTCWLPGMHETAHRLGVMEYLIKPLSHEKLLAALANLGERIKTILIVDDEEDELNLLARQIEAAGRGYFILQVTNGPRALDMLRSRHPDVMLLDLIMPGMDGFQVLEEKRCDAAIQEIPVIVITSRDPAGDPIVSHTFSVTQSGGLSQHGLITCIQALGKILAPSSHTENGVQVNSSNRS